MSSAEKQGKGKNKKATAGPKSKSPKGGKEIPLNEEKFRGDGVHFKCKLLGLAEVNGPRGDSMCIDAIKKLKHQIRDSGEHKQKIILVVTLKGIRILDEKSKALIYEHPINKVSFITHDPEDKKIFGYVCSAACQTGHMMYAIKYDKVAGVITATLYELFQVVFKIRQEAAQRRKLQASTAQQEPNGPTVTVPEPEANIYEEPKSPTMTNAVTTPEKPIDSHYKVPNARPLPPKPYGTPSTVIQEEQHNKVEVAVVQPGTDSKESTREANGDDAPLNTALTCGVTSEPFFSSSVFTHGDTPAADTASVSSVEMMRKGSMSSASSDNADTRSVDSRSGGIMSTPDVAHTPPAHHAFKGPAFHATFEEEPDYETIPSGGYETIPAAQANKGSNNTTSAAAQANKGSNNTTNAAAQANKGSNITTNAAVTNAFTAFDGDTNESRTNDKLPQLDSNGQKQTAIDFAKFDMFGKDDMFASFDNSKLDTPDKTPNDVPVDDPFLPNTGAAGKETQKGKTDLFISTDPFESAFGPGQFSPIPFNPTTFSQEANGSSDDKQVEVTNNSETKPELEISWSTAFANDTEEKGSVVESTAVSCAWDNAFGSSEPKDEVNQPTDVTPVERATPQEHVESQTIGESSDQTTGESLDQTAGVSLDGASSTSEDKDEIKQDVPEANGSETDEHDEGPSFGWGEAFRADKPTEKEQDLPQTTQENKSKEAPLEPKMEFRWSSAFEEETEEKRSGLEAVQPDASFSWDDAFGDEVNNEDGTAPTGDLTWNAAFGDGITTSDRKQPEDSNTDQQHDAFSWNAFGDASNLDGDKKNINVTTSSESSVTSSQTVAPVVTGDVLSMSDETALEATTSASKPCDPELSEHLQETEKNDVNSPKHPFGEFAVDFSVLKPEAVSTAGSQDNTREDSSNEKVKGIETDDSTLNEPVYVNRQAISPPTSPLQRPTTLTPRPPLPPMPDRPISPSAPPPLPPRHAPPSLPPRPRTYSTPSTPSSSSTPPPPPRPAPTDAPDLSQIMSPPRAGRKPPPAPPPRVDLESGASKRGDLGNIMLPTAPITLSPYGSDPNSTDTTPDPFSDAFFTDFSLPSQGPSDTSEKGLFPDPFAPVEGDSNTFTGGFDSDPFAAFGSSNKEQGSGFTAFSSEDPFSDSSSDPFADKAVLGDPFAASPSKGESKENALKLDEDPCDADFSDSFA